jgi:hypothetical protein
VEAPDAGLQHVLLVVDRDDLDQRTGRRLAGLGIGDKGKGAHGRWLLLGWRLHALDGRARALGQLGSCLRGCWEC